MRRSVGFISQRIVECAAATAFSERLEPRRDASWELRQPWESLHDHWKTLARYVEFGRSLHDCEYLRYERVGDTGHTSAESNDRYHGSGISLHVGYETLRIVQYIIRHNLAFVILEAAILAYLLQANTLMCQFSVHSPAVAIVHVH